MHDARRGATDRQALPASALAGTCYVVCFGELSFGERVLDALTATGFDAFGIAALGPPWFSTMTSVVEIVGREDRQVVYRRRAEPETVTALFDEIALDLVRLTTIAFEIRWLS
jgi:hypothetical protein